MGSFDKHRLPDSGDDLSPGPIHRAGGRLDRDCSNGGRGIVMALHDWNDPAGWEGMHHLWITELLRWVKPRLPVGYRTYIGSAPLLAVGAPAERPDLGVRSCPAGGGPEPSGPAY